MRFRPWRNRAGVVGLWIDDIAWPTFFERKNVIFLENLWSRLLLPERRRRVLRSARVPFSAPTGLEVALLEAIAFHLPGRLWAGVEQEAAGLREAISGFSGSLPELSRENGPWPDPGSNIPIGRQPRRLGSHVRPQVFPGDLASVGPRAFEVTHDHAHCSL
jgi:hypothetical protein